MASRTAMPQSWDATRAPPPSTGQPQSLQLPQQANAPAQTTTPGPAPSSNGACLFRVPARGDEEMRKPSSGRPQQAMRFPIQGRTSKRRNHAAKAYKGRICADLQKLPPTQANSCNPEQVQPVEAPRQSQSPFPSRVPSSRANIQGGLLQPGSRPVRTGASHQCRLAHGRRRRQRGRPRRTLPCSCFWRNHTS